VRELSVEIGAAGAVVEVHLGVSPDLRAALRKQRKPVPHPIPANFLIDTGAGSSLVDDGLMRSLGLAPTSAARMHSASSGGVPQPCDIFDVSLTLGGLSKPSTLHFQPLPILGLAFINHGFDGLLGRDVLNRLQLHWNGPGRVLKLTYT
jgi:hypothetical protein